MNNYGRFGALLGTLHIGSTHCRFSIYAASNAEVLTCHDVKLTQISMQPGWIEFDPIDIWKCAIESIELVTKNLIMLDINPGDIIALSITNQRETTVMWHKTNGTPLYNAIAWNDTRTASTLNGILAKNRNKKYYLKMICGLPLSTCFSAMKIKWIVDNVPDVRECMDTDECLFGTLDTWIMWNLTGGISDGGIHITDVTNAARTMLMNLETLNWDNKLCAYFQISPKILPKIKSCSEIYGFVHNGPLNGIPIAACLGDQPASLLGQLCIRRDQAICTFDEGCFVLVNTGQAMIDSNNGLLTTVAFQLGPKEKPYYALEGLIANAGSTITWLQDNLLINTDNIGNNDPIKQSATKINKSDDSCYGGLGTNENSTNNSNPADFGDPSNHQSIISLPIYNSNAYETSPSTIRAMATTSTMNKTDLVFVPAFSGLHSPFWSHNSRGLILGLNNQTTSRHITLAAYESTCYQTRDLLHAITDDLPTWPHIKKLIVGGEFSENNFFLQLLADLCDITVERPQTASPSCLGAMLAAALTMNIIELKNAHSMFSPPSDQFQPTMCSNEREIKYRRWKYAIKKCINWNHFETASSATTDAGLATIPTSDDYEDKDPALAIRCSIPGSIFITSSIALYFITKQMK